MDGWMDGWVDGWMDGRESRFKDCLQQSKILIIYNIKTLVSGWMDGWVGGWMDGWMEGKAGLRIAYSNQKHKT